MPLSDFRQRWLWAGVAYVVPWLTVYGVIRFGVGYAPWIAGDTVSGMFGFGLSWATLTPPAYYHLPIVVPSQMATLAYLLSQQIGDLKGFHDAALLLQIGFLFLAAIWFGWAIARLKVSWTIALICGVTAAAMPTSSLTAIAFTGYGPIALWAGPGVTILAIAILQGRQTDIEARWALAVIGFVAANVYSALPTAALAAVAVLISPGPEFTRQFKLAAQDARYEWLRTVLLAIALHSAIFGFSARVLERGSNFVLVVAAIVALLVALAWHRLRKRHLVIHGIEVAVLSPLLAGWVVGCNYWASRWFLNALYAAQGRGTGKEYTEPFSGLLALPAMLAASPWIILPVGAALFGLLVAMRSALRLRDRTATAPLRWLAVAVLVLLPIVLCVLTTGDLLAPPAGPVDAPISFRYFVSLLGVTAAAWALLGYLASPLRLAAVVMVTVGVFILYLVNFVPAARSVNLEQTQEAISADTRIDAFLAAMPNGSVVCLRTQMPARCGLLYGYYYSFRSDRSRERLPVPALAGGRIEYLAPCPASSSGQPYQPLCAQLLDTKLASGNPVLFIAETWTGSLAPSCHDVEKAGPNLRLIMCDSAPR